MKHIQKSFLSLLALLSMASFSHAQYRECLNHFGLDYQSFPSAKMVIPTADGPIAVGSIEESVGSGNYDIYLTQFNNTGGVVWARRYGTPGNSEVVKAAIKGSANNVVIVGQKNYQEASITSIDISTGTVSWNRNIGVGTPFVIENLTTVAEIGTTGEYMAMGTVFQSGKLELLSVKFNNTGTIFWSKLLPEFVLDPHPFDLTAVNLVDLPLEDRMALTGTASISGSNEKVYAAYVDKATGTIAEFKVYDIALFGNNTHCVAGDIYRQASNKMALAFTAYNDTKSSSRIMYMQLRHNTSPSNELTPNFLYGYNIAYGMVSLIYNHGLNIYRDGSGMDIGMKFGTSASNVMPGILQISNSGNIISVEAHLNYDNYSGIAMTQDGGTGYYMKSKLGSDAYIMTHTDLNGATVIPCSRPTIASRIPDYEANTAVFSLLSVSHGAFSSDVLSSDDVSGYITSCDGSWTGFKKEATSIEETTRQEGVYPSVINHQDVVYVQSDQFTGEELRVAINNTLGQEVYSLSVHPQAGERIPVPAGELAKGINLVSVYRSNGQLLLSSKVIKQ